MKLFLAGAALIAAPFASYSPQSPLQANAVNTGTPQRSLLANGGFESWPHGDLYQGPIAPGHWYAMGSTTNFYGQNAIDITKVAEDPACSTGAPWAADVRAIVAGNYISQQLDDFAGLADSWITFSVRLRSEFTTYPKVEIHDGHATSVAQVAVGPIFGVERYTRVTVHHKVSKCATKLEFRIRPDLQVQIADAMAVVGKINDAIYVPQQNVEAGLIGVPLGTVIDWYRFDSNTPLPRGYKICDGSVISAPQDAGSPFLGQTTPNLTDKFVRGATTFGGIGTTGGAADVNLSHTHTHPHTHSGNVVLNGLSWFVENWGFSQCPRQNSSHDFTTGQPSNPTTSAALGTVSTVPPYFGLLKIMRIK